MGPKIGFTSDGAGSVQFRVRLQNWLLSEFTQFYATQILWCYPALYL
jgi:hypothetical protein